MAGRILTTLRKIEELEAMAMELAVRMCATTPRQYIERPDGRDPLGVAWLEAIDGTMKAGVQVQRLGDLLREKARVRRPGPAAVFLADAPEPAPAE